MTSSIRSRSSRSRAKTAASRFVSLGSFMVVDRPTLLEQVFVRDHAAGALAAAAGRPRHASAQAPRPGAALALTSARKTTWHRLRLSPAAFAIGNRAPRAPRQRAEARGTAQPSIRATAAALARAPARQTHLAATPLALAALTLRNRARRVVGSGPKATTRLSSTSGARRLALAPAAKHVRRLRPAPAELALRDRAAGARAAACRGRLRSASVPGCRLALAPAAQTHRGGRFMCGCCHACRISITAAIPNPTIDSSGYSESLQLHLRVPNSRLSVALRFRHLHGQP
jgi:hypothetical protein